MAGNIDLSSLGSSVPSLDLDNLIRQHHLDKWPEHVNTVSSGTTVTSQSTDVVHTTSLNFASDQQTVEIEQPAAVNQYEPNVCIVIENRMVRFRYDSELNNRNYGKEVLVKIVITNFMGKVKIRIHAVDDKKKKAHPFCLIGEKCVNGVYIEDHEISSEKTECICKATPRIPKQKDYDIELNLRKSIMNDPNKFPLITEDMNKDDYWMANKNIKESKEIILMVEVVFFSSQDGTLKNYISLHSEPISNAKDGKKFEVYAVSPPTSSASQSYHDPHFIILTADSYSPNESDIEVRFYDDGNWTTTVRGKVIKNVIEFYFPGYGESISIEKNIYVSVYDKKRKIETSKKTIILKPTDNDILEHKRKKTTFFSLPEMTIKTEERPSCSGGQRKIHKLRKSGSGNKAHTSSLDMKELEEQGMLSLNIGSPSNQSFADLTSTSVSANEPVTSFNQPSSSSSFVPIPDTISALLAPSGSRDMQSQQDIFNSQLNMGNPDQQNLLNNIAGQSESASLSSNNGLDLSQEQTLSLSQITNLLQYRDVLKLLGLNSDGQGPLLNSYNQSGLPSQLTEAEYDPHNIRLEDLVDDMEQNDIEVDCGQITSSTEVKQECEQCKDKAETKTDKPVSSDQKSEKTSNSATSETKVKINKEESVLQSNTITSNVLVDSDIEED